LSSQRISEPTKGAIYFCFPNKDTIEQLIEDFTDEPCYKEALFISPSKTLDAQIQVVRQSSAREYLKSWKDCYYDFSGNLKGVT
jgi:hypothetical protein